MVVTFPPQHMVEEVGKIGQPANSNNLSLYHVPAGGSDVLLWDSNLQRLFLMQASLSGTSRIAFLFPETGIDFTLNALLDWAGLAKSISVSGSVPVALSGFPADGMLLRYNDSGIVYLIVGGAHIPVPDPTILAQLDPDEIAADNADPGGRAGLYVHDPARWHPRPLQYQRFGLPDPGQFTGLAYPILPPEISLIATGRRTLPVWEGALDYLPIAPWKPALLAWAGGASASAPGTLQTALEIPTFVTLRVPDPGTPDAPMLWLAQNTFAPSNGRSPLWHVRRATRSAGGIDTASPTRLFFGSSPFVGQSDTFQLPVPTALNVHDINSVVKQFDGSDGKYLQTEKVVLSALGSWLKLRDVVDGVSGENSIHTVSMGRDQFVRIVRRGFLFPFGHKATLVAISQRKFIFQNQGTGVVPDGTTSDTFTCEEGVHHRP